jgi:hypothetical protein
MSASSCLGVVSTAGQRMFMDQSRRAARVARSEPPVPVDFLAALPCHVSYSSAIFLIAASPREGLPGQGSALPIASGDARRAPLMRWPRAGQ